MAKVGYDVGERWRQKPEIDDNSISSGRSQAVGNAHSTHPVPVDWEVGVGMTRRDSHSSDATEWVLGLGPGESPGKYDGSGGGSWEESGKVRRVRGRVRGSTMAPSEGPGKYDG